MKLVSKRVADPRVLKLIEQFLKAGLLEEGIFHETEAGTPQGGVLSPLLANIYLNELDQWWWRNYGSKTHNEKRKNRNKGKTNAILTRYADDFCILCNGGKEDAEALRDELKKFLWDELHLELSEEKTHVTHIDDGLDFLGFHIQRYTPKDNLPWVRIAPSQENVKRFTEKLKKLTRYNTTFMPVTEKLRVLNRLIRGWGNYYRNVNFALDAAQLDWWINKRVLTWLMCKHKGLGVRAILDIYKVREKFGTHNRWNFGTKDGEGKMIYVSKLTDIRLGRYRPKHRPNPYLCEELADTIAPTPLETPFTQSVPTNFSPEKTDWLELRQKVLERDNFRCVRCGSTTPPFQTHHITARKDEGKDEMENLETLCNQCHIQTESYGRNKRDEKFEGKLDEGKLSCPV
jgi:RNA-directed DNA polymerase